MIHISLIPSYLLRILAIKCLKVEKQLNGVKIHRKIRWKLKRLKFLENDYETWKVDLIFEDLELVVDVQDHRGPYPYPCGNFSSRCRIYEVNKQFYHFNFSYAFRPDEWYDIKLIKIMDKQALIYEIDEIIKSYGDDKHIKVAGLSNYIIDLVKTKEQLINF